MHAQNLTGPRSLILRYLLVSVLFCFPTLFIRTAKALARLFARQFECEGSAEPLLFAHTLSTFLCLPLLILHYGYVTGTKGRNWLLKIWSRLDWYPSLHNSSTGEKITLSSDPLLMQFNGRGYIYDSTFNFPFIYYRQENVSTFSLGQNSELYLCNQDKYLAMTWHFTVSYM